MILKIYTDGACSNNGRANAKAGLGVYFGNNDQEMFQKELLVNKLIMLQNYIKL